MPCLWFDGNGEDAARFYTSIFKDSKIRHVARYSDAVAEAAGRPKGSVMAVNFELEGQEFLALNGGPMFTFSPAISFIVNCETQREVDELWEKLSHGGAKERCGWLKDKFGVSWQIVPTIVGEIMQDKNAAKVERAMNALMQMDKIDIESLRRAYEQR